MAVILNIPNLAHAKPPERKKLKLTYVDLRGPLQPRQWLVEDRIPMSNVTLFSGEGGAGKSLVAMLLSSTAVLGIKWYGVRVAKGPVIYVSCEEDNKELRWRFNTIARYLGTTRDALMEAGLHVISKAGKDAAMGVPDKDGHIKETEFWQEVCEDAEELQPKLIVLDTNADVFAGNEINRVQVRQFITQLRALAMQCGAAILLISHPSLTGIKSESGLSGSTGWHNSVRARMYLTLNKDDKSDEDEHDSGFRELKFLKNQYGRRGETVILERTDDGLFIAVDEKKQAQQQHLDGEKYDDLFLLLLDRFTAAGRNVTDKKGTSYAPAMFAPEPEAKKMKATSHMLAEAMRRLFADKRILVASHGSPSKQRNRIVREK